jgi:hypothetical protein
MFSHTSHVPIRALRSLRCRASTPRHSEEEEEEQQEEDEVEEPQEEIQGAAMAEKCDMTPRLQFWYGNSKDRTSIEWWCDAVDRIKDQKGWNDDQGEKSAALVAVDAIDVNHHLKKKSGGRHHARPFFTTQGTHCIFPLIYLSLLLLSSLSNSLLHRLQVGALRPAL